MHEIKAEPTKEFFVDMITRDIALDRAILDLIDNSIDGAHRLRPHGNFKGLYVSLTINKTLFCIEDNCGGIPIDIAKNQAFRFGKPKNYDAPDHSIGRFGIGMKRALFKLGALYNVVSVHAKSSFKLNFDVNEWLTKSDWNFDFSEEPLYEINQEYNCRTIISVENLHPDVIAEFNEDFVIRELSEDVALTHSLIMNKGFKVYINGRELSRKKFNIKNTENIAPFIVNFAYPPNSEENVVNVKIVAGVDDRSLHQGGWYIFCNDRLIVDAEQSVMTGWEKKTRENQDKNPIGQYHADFAFFKGYVMFDAHDAALLPWTTTKTGLNADSKVYKAALHEMKIMMRKIMDFLRERAVQESKFKKDEIDGSPLTKLLEDANRIEFFELEQKEQKFYYFAEKPKVLEKIPEPQGGTISFWKPEEELTLMKKYLKVKTNREVGIVAFDYYLELIKDS